MKPHLAKLIATFFYSGLFPVAPGTAGSLAALIALFLLLPFLTPLLLLALCLLTYVLGVWSANAYMAATKTHDPGAIVIDEVVGIFITALIAWPYIHTTTTADTLIAAMMVFVTFRFFDIVKPWPIRWLDKHVKNGTGVMVDDVAAGFFAGVISYFALYGIYNYGY